MKQVLNKLFKQKTMVNKVIGKIYYNIETNEEKINKINKEIKTIKRAIHSSKMKNNECDDLSLRISELKNSTVHYENDIIVLKSRIIEFQGKINNIFLKIKRIRYNIKIMKHDKKRCAVCKIDMHRASMSRHLKSKKHLENLQQNKVTIPTKKPIKQVVKDEIKVPDIDIKDENLYFLFDKILKAAYNITVENHHDKDVNSVLTIIPNYEIIGIADYYIDKIVMELAIIYSRLVNQCKIKYQLSLLAFLNKNGEEGEITSQIELIIILTIT